MSSVVPQPVPRRPRSARTTPDRATRSGVLFSRSASRLALLEPAQYAIVRHYGLGLTDLAKTVPGSDGTLLQEHFDRDSLRAKLRHFRPKILAFTASAPEKSSSGVQLNTDWLKRKSNHAALCAPLAFRDGASLLVGGTLARIGGACVRRPAPESEPVKNGSPASAL